MIKLPFEAGMADVSFSYLRASRIHLDTGVPISPELRPRSDKQSSANCSKSAETNTFSQVRDTVDRREGREGGTVGSEHDEPGSKTEGCPDYLHGHVKVLYDPAVTVDIEV